MKYYATNERCVDAYVNKRSYDGRTPNSNVYFERDVIFSYGEHFPMAVRLSDGFYILNGDRYSSTTSNHQSLLFQAIPNCYRVEIPFSALREAFAEHGVRYMSGLVREIQKIKVLDWIDDSYVDTGRLNKEGEKIFDHVLGGSLFEYEGRKFISSLDSSGSGRGLFFLTELADKSVNTVVEAFESMKPDSVKRAEEEGSDVMRQGEWFFIPIDDLLDSVKEHAKKKYVLKNSESDREDRHFVTEGMSVQGRQFAKGVVRHSRGEHKMLKLYDEGTKVKDRIWFEAFENVQVNSWSASGDVD